MKQQIVVQSLFMTFTVLGFFSVTLKTRQGNLPIAQTYAFATLILSELLRAFTSRSETTPIFKLGLFTNKHLLVGTSISFVLLLAVIYIGPLQGVFDTVYLTFHDWRIIFAFSLIPAITAEISKLF